MQSVQADVVTSAAVNAGVVRSRAEDTDPQDRRIALVMRERMGRVLYLFEKHGVRRLVLGSFGTGVFRNDVQTIACIWKELLQERFKNTFDEVLFSIFGRDTFETFLRVFAE